MRFSPALARKRLPDLWESIEGLRSLSLFYVWERDALELTLTLSYRPIVFTLDDKGLHDGYGPQDLYDLYRGQVLAWIERIEARVAAEAAAERLAPIKEELMAAAWAPARVTKWLEAGLTPEEL